MTSRQYGDAPRSLGRFDISLKEVMHYLYLPVRMPGDDSLWRLPENLKCCERLLGAALDAAPRGYQYAYLTARHGWATPDNPINRPGWHCDGFGTDDMNYIWSRGSGTRFALQPFVSISADHDESLRQFEAQLRPEEIHTYGECELLELDPFVVHATPALKAPEWREFIKISLSDHRYNLVRNSHNYLFDYDWPMVDRAAVRNDPHAGQSDYASEVALRDLP